MAEVFLIELLKSTGAIDQDSKDSLQIVYRSIHGPEIEADGFHPKMKIGVVVRHFPAKLVLFPNEIEKCIQAEEPAMGVVGVKKRV